MTRRETLRQDTPPMPLAALRRTAAAVVLISALAACQPITRNHGFVPSETDLAAVVVGQTTEADVRALLGAPAAQGMLTNSSWFWVRSRFETVGPFRPTETTREVVAVTFADTGMVANVERFGLERGRIVRLSTRVTDPGVTAAGALRQILSNFGRFRAGQVLGGGN